jgi:N-acetyl-anhydromuramoyl-L-alanine amidase
MNIEPIKLIAPGWLNVCHKPSPFYNLRPSQIVQQDMIAHQAVQVPNIIDTIVIHNISLPPSQYGLNWIHDLFQGHLSKYSDQELNHPYLIMVKNFEVSSHFMINRQGEIFQYVSADLRAWHAGRSSLTIDDKQRENCNDFSIGIELEGDDFSDFTQIQYQYLAELINALVNHYPIQYCTAHSYIAPDRKTDPGPYFNWQMLQNLMQQKMGHDQNIEKTIRYFHHSSDK